MPEKLIQTWGFIGYLLGLALKHYIDLYSI